MYIDSQAVIQASTSNRPVLGHYPLDMVHIQYHIVQKIHSNMEMTIRWSPRHSDIPGNEAADKAAHKAAEGNTTAIRYLLRLLQDGLPHSKSVAQQTENVKEMVIAVWKQSTWYARIDYLVLGLPQQNYFMAITKLSHKHTSIIIQLITGHILLAKHLHQINKANSLLCLCCHEHEEMVSHFILHWPTHWMAQVTLFKGTPHAEQNLPQLLSTNEARSCLLNFIAHTTHLWSVFGDVPPVNNS